MSAYVPTITGPCGHTAPFDEWTRTPVSGDLPPGQFQCPVCGRAFRRHGIGYRVMPDGYAVPSRVDVRDCEGRM